MRRASTFLISLFITVGCTTVQHKQSQPPCSVMPAAYPPGTKVCAQMISLSFSWSDLNAFDESLEQHLRTTIAYLKENPTKHIQIESHNYSARTKEQNFDAGQRLAGLARIALIEGGAAKSQITTIPFGDEKSRVPSPSLHQDSWIAIEFLNEDASGVD